MCFRVPGLKKTFSGIVCAALSVVLTSCNQNYNYLNNGVVQQKTGLSNLPMRAFVSNPAHPSLVGTATAAIEIMDARQDLVSGYSISLVSLGANVTDPGLMVESPNKDRTLVFSSADTKVGVVDNTKEQIVGTIAVPGNSESMLMGSDGITAYVAVPSAPVTGQPAGAVVRLNTSAGTTTATIPVPSAHYLVQSPNGNQILVFSDNTNSITLLTPSLIGTTTQSATQTPCTSTPVGVCTISGSFDRPIGSVFNASGTTAYILNCGLQCGGAGVGACLSYSNCTTVAALDMTQTPPAITGAPIGVPAATIGFLQGNSLYVAGTPTSASDNNCTASSPSTAAATCGRLSVIDLNTSAVAATLTITDGYHQRIEMGANQQLFVGARNCTNINVQGGESRGCLTIVDTSSGGASSTAIVAPANGNVTGIEPIPNRTVVYVCQGGALRIYDTTTDALQTNPLQPNIIGQAIDVKAANF